LSLRGISNIKPVYIIPRDNIAKKLLIPALMQATSYDVMSAFFHSSALKELAPGLATFINHSDGKMRLIISPQLSSKEVNFLEKGLNEPQDTLNNWFMDYILKYNLDENLIEKFSLECLLYLIKEDRINIKFAYMKSGALFHSKVSILADENDSIVIHGSTNFTPPGLTKNWENARVEKSWAGESEILTIQSFQKEFESLWNNKERNLVITYPISDALKEKLVSKYDLTNKPSIENYFSIIKQKSMEQTSFDIELPKKEFKIPNYLSYREGDYKHQGEALEAWIENGYTGILQMCTGSGKTITSLLCAYYLHQIHKPLLIIISAPYLPLIYQWSEEVEKFGISPSVIGGNLTRNGKFEKVSKLFRKLKYSNLDVGVIICTNHFLCDDQFQNSINKFNQATLLIADEVHNLGAEGYSKKLPEIVQYRLGLSATPIRQYDDSGTNKLIDYFGKIVKKYDLSDAINFCLVPYYYYVYPVHLNIEEIEKWLELTSKLKKMGWMLDKDNSDPRIESILRKRRLIIENSEEKLERFKEIFSAKEFKDVKHTLVYASDKNRKQLESINHFLMKECGLLMHQVTGGENSTGLSQSILRAFESGETLQVLTAMRVLDEGINIPQIKEAFILASTTVKRQWVQRRGRVLRKCEAVNKEHALIHDFLVLGPESKDFTQLLKSEIKRIYEFAKLSKNPYEKNGGLTIANQLLGY